MTALALAGTDGDGVARPDSILPPGFDRLGEVVRFEQGPLVARRGRPNRRDVSGADLVPCTRCGLRGHVAGDPERCLFYRGSLGMGGQAAATVTAAMWQGGEGRRRRRHKGDAWHQSDRGREGGASP